MCALQAQQHRTHIERNIHGVPHTRTHTRAKGPSIAAFGAIILSQIMDNAMSDFCNVDPCPPPARHGPCNGHGPITRARPVALRQFGVGHAGGAVTGGGGNTISSSAHPYDSFLVQCAVSTDGVGRGAATHVKLLHVAHSGVSQHSSTGIYGSRHSRALSRSRAAPSIEHFCVSLQKK